MLSALRRLVLLLGVCSAATAVAQVPPPGQVASQQTRYIAIHFPGRMTGTPAEMLSADYLRQQFSSWGYKSDIRQFNGRYLYTEKSGRQIWHSATGSNVIAARKGKRPQEIIVMAHLDTYAPLSDSDSDHNLGGLTLQGVNDNAAGLGVMLELAEQLKSLPLEYGVRFVATSGEEQHNAGGQDLLNRMSASEKKHILLVIDLNNLVAGNKLWFASGNSTPGAVRKITQERALTLAHKAGIPATSPASGVLPHNAPCCGEASTFDKTGIPVLYVGTPDPSPEPQDEKQSAKSRQDIDNWHNVQRDNLDYLDKWTPGRIEKRNRDVMRILLPLIKELTHAGK